MSISITLENIINFFMIAAGFGISLLVIIQVNGAPIRKDVKKYLSVFFSAIIVYVLMHLTRQTLDGIAGDGVRIAIKAVTFIEFLVSGIMAFILSVVILFIAKPDRGRKTASALYIAVLALHAALLVVSQFTDLFYSFDASNSYSRSPLYLLSNLASLLLMLQSMFLLVKYRNKFAPRVLAGFWVYLTAPLVAMVLQAFLPKIQFIIFATVIAAVYMSTVIIKDQTVKYEEKQLEATRLDSELTMASNIQSRLLPYTFPAFPERSEFDIYAKMVPAKEIGGDFYDFFFVDHDRLAMVIADVSGKGIPAALFMMMTKSIISSLVKAGNSPAEAMTKANRSVYESNPEGLFVTVWLGVLELSSGKLTAVNAGHEKPVIRRNGEPFEVFRDKRGVICGATPDAEYSEYTETLSPGDTLFLYTDGVPETTDSKYELFGIERTLVSLNKDPNAAPEELIARVFADAEAFVAGAPQFDDTTMLCMTYKGCNNE